MDRAAVNVNNSKQMGGQKDLTWDAQVQTMPVWSIEELFPN